MFCKVKGTRPSVRVHWVACGSFSFSFSLVYFVRQMFYKIRHNYSSSRVAGEEAHEETIRAYDFELLLKIYSIK